MNYGHAVCQDISRQTVCRSEVYAAWQLVGRSRWWLRDRLTSLIPSACVVSVICDATNSSIWQQRKLQSLIAEMLVLQQDGRRMKLTQSADLLPVEDASALGAEALCLKQLRNMGVPLWNDADRGRARLYAYVMTTDCGPDQAACRRNICAKCWGMDGVCFIAIDCQMHQMQLIVGRGLSVLAMCLKDCQIAAS